MDISTLAVYNFPCNVSIDSYEMALSTWAERLLVSLPMFTTNSVSYVKCKPDSSDQTILQLHHQSLTIPPETKINHSIVKELDNTYQHYDSQLSATLHKVDSLVDQINETAEDSLSVSLTYAALALSVLNSVSLIIPCKCIYRVLLRISQAALSASPLQPTVSVQHHTSSTVYKTSQEKRPCKKPGTELNLFDFKKYLNCYIKRVMLFPSIRTLYSSFIHFYFVFWSLTHRGRCLM